MKFVAVPILVAVIGVMSDIKSRETGDALLLFAEFRSHRIRLRFSEFQDLSPTMCCMLGITAR